MLIRHAPCFSKSVGLGKKRIEPVVQKTYQTLDPSLKLKVTQLLQKCRIAKNITKSSPRMWKLSVCLSGLLARVAIFACVAFLMSCHVTRQVTWFPRNLQRAFDPTGALCPTLPYYLMNCDYIHGQRIVVKMAHIRRTHIWMFKSNSHLKSYHIISYEVMMNNGRW